MEPSKHAHESVSGTLVKMFFWLFFCTSRTRATYFLGIFFLCLVEPCLNSVVLPALVPVLSATSEERLALPVSAIILQGAANPEPGAFLLATIQPAASTSCLIVLSTIRSPRGSLGSKIVTLSDPVETYTSVVWLTSRGVRNPLAITYGEHSLRATSAPLSPRPVALLALYTPSQSALSLLLASCCSHQTISSTYLDLLELWSTFLILILLSLSALPWSHSFVRLLFSFSWVTRQFSDVS